MDILEHQKKQLLKKGYCIVKNFLNDDQIRNFDSSFSDGQFKKTADNSKLMKLIKHFDFTPIDIGIKKSIEWFIKNYDMCRK